jgi:hypothetical protein
MSWGNLPDNGVQKLMALIKTPARSVSTPGAVMSPFLIITDSKQGVVLFKILHLILFAEFSSYRELQHCYNSHSFRIFIGVLVGTICIMPFGFVLVMETGKCS